ncbi:hypothetical protein AVM71_14075 [Piscirickettsia salmonis]|nr:hypothetical protein AVM71_14075 [Piscirickettsia salmonis]
MLSTPWLAAEENQSRYPQHDAQKAGAGFPIMRLVAIMSLTTGGINDRKRRYLGRYFAHPMMQNRRAKRDDYKPSAVRVTQRCVP